VKGTHLRIIHARFGLIWFNGLREDLNMKAYDVRQTDDDRRLSSNDGNFTTYDERTMMTKAQTKFFYCLLLSSL
jgi:hypothetical protein